MKLCEPQWKELHIIWSHDSEKQFSKQYNFWSHLLVFLFLNGHITQCSVYIDFQMGICWNIVAVAQKTILNTADFVLNVLFFCFKKRGKKSTKTKTHTQDWQRLSFKLTENAEHEQITCL